MQMEGLIPLKFYIDQAIASLYFLKVSSGFYSLNSVNAAEIITGFALLVLRNHTLIDWVIPSRLTLMSLFLFLLFSIHYCIFLYCFHQY